MIWLGMPLIFTGAFLIWHYRNRPIIPVVTAPTRLEQAMEERAAMGTATIVWPEPKPPAPIVPPFRTWKQDHLVDADNQIIGEVIDWGNEWWAMAEDMRVGKFIDRQSAKHAVDEKFKMKDILRAEEARDPRFQLYSGK